MRAETPGIETARDLSREDIRLSVARFGAWSLVLLAVASLCVWYFTGRSEGGWMAVTTAPLIALFCGFSMASPGLFRDGSGRNVSRFEAANMLTALRLFLVPPTMVLLVTGHIMWGMSSYLLILITDVADGWVARRYSQETVFGLMLDPFADIASTTAVFCWLWSEGAVPSWLFIILLLRYGEFFFGIIILKLMGRIPRLEATIAGKAAGVVQGLSIIFLIGQRADLWSLGRDAGVDVIHYLLAAAFLSVIISQTSIGIKALRNTE